LQGFYVYRFIDESNCIIYIGRTTNMDNRMLYQHFTNKGHLKKECYEKTKKVEYAKLISESEMKIYELYLINKCNPIYNSKDKNNDFFSFELPNLKWKKYDKIFIQDSISTGNEIKINCTNNTKIIIDKYNLNKIIKYMQVNISPFSVNDICNITNESKTITNLKLNLLVLIGLLEKTGRRLNCYKKNSNFDPVKTDEISILFLNKHCNLKDINFLRIRELFGDEFASKAFPLSDKTQIELPQIKNVVTFVKTIIERQGWLTEVDLKEYIRKLEGIKISHIKQYINYLYEELKVQRIQCNKQIKQMLNINNDQIPSECFPVVLIKC
jgi:hypothetical protein